MSLDIKRGNSPSWSKKTKIRVINMLTFFLVFLIFPLGIGIALFLLALLVRLRMDRDPKFNQWVNEVFPNEAQRKVIVTAVIAIVYVWIVLKTGVTF